MTKKQTVIRTVSKRRGYSYDTNSYQYLEKLLDDGWKVVMVTSIDGDNEYILEKDIEE